MKEVITEKMIEQHFREVFNELNKKQKKVDILLSREWVQSFPEKPGVYCVFERGNLKYVGESGNLKGRMTDMLNTMHHTLRRSIGMAKFSKMEGYEVASSKKRYIESIEKKLNQYIMKYLTVSCLPMQIGRKEFEDWLQEKHPQVEFYNKRKQRKN